MPAGRRRFRRERRYAGAWPWLLAVLLLLLVVPLPGRAPARPMPPARPAAAYVAKTSAAAAAVRYALNQLGKRYQWGGTGPRAYDCSGLTMMSYRAAGVRIPRVSRWQYGFAQHVPLGHLAAGDLVFYARDTANPSTIYHVGMYLGAGRMVEAANHTVPIRIASIWRSGLMRLGVRPASSSSPMLWVLAGQQGAGVAAVQSRLRANGLCLSVDGAFGPVTLASVRRFQRAHGLLARGRVGPITWGALVSHGRQRSRSPAC